MENGETRWLGQAYCLGRRDFRKDMAGPVDPVTRRLALLLLMLALIQAAAPQVVPQDGPDID